MKISLKRTIPIDKLNADYPAALATFVQSSQDQRLAKVKYPQCIFSKNPISLSILCQEAHEIIFLPSHFFSNFICIAWLRGRESLIVEYHSINMRLWPTRLD